VGENTAYAMEALGGRGMAEDRSLSERSIDGRCRASAAEPELPGEVTGGLEAIENDRSSRREDIQSNPGQVCHMSRSQLRRDW
jgi:hypothetical protein